MNSARYGHIWGALVPRNEGAPLADYDVLAVQTLHSMCQQYRLPGSKGYLVLIGYIPSVVEWLVAYMAKFGVPWFPETKASLWQIMIYGSLDPTLYVPAISAPWVKGLYGTHRLYTLFCGMNSGVYGKVWVVLVPTKPSRTSGRLWFYGSPYSALYEPAISAPWVKGLFGTHRFHTLWCGMNSGVYGQVWGALDPRNEAVPLVDYDIMAV